MNTKYLFSKELIEKLKPIHNHLENASRFHYKRGSTQAENDLLTEVWYELTNEKLTGFNCGNCCLRNYQQVGKVYFESVEYWDAQDKLMAEVTANENNENKNNDEQCAQETRKVASGRRRKGTVSSSNV